jgi:hypothetical protein
MALRITIDVFSGRPNPVIALDDDASREVAERIRPADRLKRDEAKPPPESLLGYRGMIPSAFGSSTASSSATSWRTARPTRASRTTSSATTA